LTLSGESTLGQATAFIGAREPLPLFQVLVNIVDVARQDCEPGRVNGATCMPLRSCYPALRTTPNRSRTGGRFLQT